MAKLTDTQAILLSTAAQRDGGSLLPAPEILKIPANRLTRVVATLIKRGLATEIVAATTAQAWRADGEQHIGAVISEAGRQAIGIEAEVSDALLQGTAKAEAHDVSDESFSERRPTKTALVLTLLRREQGATLAELVEATGWLPHTTRAALTGLRKKGHAFVKGKRDEVTCYTVAKAA